MRPLPLAPYAVLAALLLATAPVRALPLDGWDLARAPDGARLERMMDEAEEKIEQSRATRRREVRRALATEARQMLDENHAESSPDLRMRLLLGEALHLLDDDSRLISVVAPVVRLAPDSPELIPALFSLAVAYARTEQPRLEIATYDRLLERVTDSVFRSLVYSNRAEAREKVGDLDGSIDDYRASIELHPESVLPRWGLAFTLDRSGDLGRAVEEGMLAYDLDHGEVSLLDDKDVFFVPAYQLWWLHALRQVSAARREPQVEAKIDHWERAARFWELYLSQALSSDRFTPLARARRKLCEVTIARLRAQIAKDRRAPGARPASRALERAR